jgi:multidrug efflux system membrane fusion protein
MGAPNHKPTTAPPSTLEPHPRESPIDGRTGNLTGNVVPPNTTELVTINQIEPIYATFAVPESKLNDVKRYMAGGKVQVLAKLQDAAANEPGTLTFR